MATESRPRTLQGQPVLDVHLIGGFANRMIEYLVIRQLAAKVQDCRISNAVLPDWNINHPPVPGGPDPSAKVSVAQNYIDISEIARSLSTGQENRHTFRSYAQWFPNFPDLDSCRKLFRADEDIYPGYGPEYLVCSVRGQEILNAIHPSYTILPIDFYEDLAKTIGLKLVFMGQIDDNCYCDALKRRFPEALFQPTRGVVADFQTLRNSKNIVVAVSTFSWLAAWLSNADSIVLPVSGLFHPMQCPEVDLLPISDPRYRFYLFPINYAVPLAKYEEAHKSLRGNWRRVHREAISELRDKATATLQPALERYVAMFDEEFYLQTYPDVARAVQTGGFPNGRHHYVRTGFKENRQCFRFDTRWYCLEYPLAAFEVGQGDYADLRHHYAEIGSMRGYRPFPDARG